jgi:hypothetical protein
MFDHFQEIDAKDHVGKWYQSFIIQYKIVTLYSGKWYQAFVIEAADDGIAVHFSGWSQIWDEFVPTSQIAARVRSRSSRTETGEGGAETVEEVRALYSGFTHREHDTMRRLRKGDENLYASAGHAPDDSATISSPPVSYQDMKKELEEFKESLIATENMLGLYVTTHSAVSPEDAKIILEVRELMKHVKLLMNM